MGIWKGVWSPAVSGIVSGIVNVYAGLPTPETSYTGQFWLVRDDSGGVLSSSGVYKYPKGIYSPNASNVWQLVPINVKVSEDTTTLINITNWAEYIGFIQDTAIGDRVLYDDILYKNITGATSANAPDVDTTNWAGLDLWVRDAINGFITPRYTTDDVMIGSSTNPDEPLHVRSDFDGNRAIRMQNESAGTAAVARFIADTDGGSTFFTSYGANFTLNGAKKPSSAGIIASNAMINGMSITAKNAAGQIRFYAGGDQDADLSMMVKPDKTVGLLLGAFINEFSIDGTLVGDSDLAVPTEKAVKTYVDTRPKNLSASSSFTSQGILAGVFYKLGFYDWLATDANLDEGSLTIALGTSGRTYAAHVGIVPSGPGSVNTGQVGLRVVGTLDDETGVQVASQTGIITDDITTLTVDDMFETIEKFSGQVSIELYIVSGAPTVYSLDFNYGYSKYEDFFNTKVTVENFQAQWQGNANDAAFNIRLLHHKKGGWTYAATGFAPGCAEICSRLIDQQIESNVVNNEDGAYKRVALDVLVESNGSEGIIIEVTTGLTNTIQTMDMYVKAMSVEV